jgi:hypothetical protein
MAWASTVDRPAGRHAGMRSLLPRLSSKRSMEAHRAQATATQRSGDLGVAAVSETRKLAAILSLTSSATPGLQGRTRIAFLLGCAPYGAI